MGLLDTHSSVQFSSVAQSCLTLCDPTNRSTPASLSITKSQSLPKLMPIESVMPFSHLILCHPLLLLPPIPPSIRVFSNESALHMRWPKHWSFSFSISPSNEHPGLIPLGWTGWISLQSKGLSRVFSNTQFKSISFQCSAFFIVQLLRPYMTTGKTITFTRRTFVGKVMSLLFNIRNISSQKKSTITDLPTESVIKNISTKSRPDDFTGKLFIGFCFCFSFVLLSFLV